MTAESDFHDVLAGAPDPADDAFRPSRIAAAAAFALRAAGASLSVKVSELRFPLGASDADAAHAESQQFTLGEGPCIVALDTGIVVDGSATELEQRWPELAGRWRELASFRSAASLPVVVDGVSAALDVYLTGPEGRAGLDDERVAVVSRLVNAELDVPDAGQSWDSMSPRSRRGRVWIAIGLLGAYGQIDPDEALRRLRAYARDRDTEVDRLGQRLVDGTLRVEQLMC